MGIAPNLHEYPLHLDAVRIAELLPHSGEILFAKSLVIHSSKHFSGTGFWDSNLAAIKGHFDFQPCVPGVYLIEALAQLAGAGILMSDAKTKANSQGMVGVLASVRKCMFRGLVLPLQSVEYDIHCRQMAEQAVHVRAEACVEGNVVADLEILLANTPIAPLRIEYLKS